MDGAFLELNAEATEAEVKTVMSTKCICQDVKLSKAHVTLLLFFYFDEELVKTMSSPAFCLVCRPRSEKEARTKKWPANTSQVVRCTDKEGLN